MTIGVTEAAKIAGVRPQRIRELIHQGKLPATKQHGTWQIDLPAVNNYARHHKARHDPNLMDAHQAAAHLGTSPAIVLRWARLGHLPIANTRRDHHRYGRPRYLFTPDNVEAMRPRVKHPTTNGNQYTPHQKATTQT